jgi:hypothetical protein
MGSMADAFNKAGIKPTDFPEVELDTQKLECDMQIEFLENGSNYLSDMRQQKKNTILLLSMAFYLKSILNYIRAV